MSRLPRAGILPLPVSRYVTTSAFRGISDQTMSYRFAGSFVLHMRERFGIAGTLLFFRTNNRDETLGAIRARFLSVYGVSLEDIEASWLAMLRSS